MMIMGGFIVNVWIVAAVLIRILLAAAVIFFMIKAIDYLRRKEERDTQRDYRSAQNTIDEIERELNDRK